jgi:hypothetical protein
VTGFNDDATNKNVDPRKRRASEHPLGTSDAKSSSMRSYASFTANFGNAVIKPQVNNSKSITISSQTKCGFKSSNKGKSFPVYTGRVSTDTNPTKINVHLKMLKLNVSNFKNI